MATKKTTAKPSSTVTKEQITELQRLNARQAQADAAALATEQALNAPYVSPDVPTGSDAAVAAAEAAAAEAERIQADIAAAGGEKAFVQKNAPKGTTTAQMNAILPQGQKINGGDNAILGFDALIPQFNNGSPFSYSDYNDDGWLVAHYADGSTKYIVHDPSKSFGKAKFTATDGTKFYDEKSYKEYQDYIDGKRSARQSAYDLMFEQFSQYGLGSLVEPLKGLITDSSVSPSEFAIRLRQTEAYKKRFAANASRIGKGLAALSEGEYLALEDQYQNIMRNYGLPASYYQKGDLGVQKAFENLIANDVSAVELEDRVQTAYNRVINAAPEVSAALKTFYPGITNGDILAYALDPENALTELKRKVTAAEIGGAATQFGLQASLTGAEALAGYGVTQAQARQGYQTIADILPRGSQLASIYKQEPYTQTTAESEVFGVPGAAEASAKRKKLAQLEQASFSGSSGTSSAISRDRSGAF